VSAARPTIGIFVTGPHINNAWLWLAVMWAGGKPVFISADDPHFDDALDGLLLTGGSDIHPELYGGIPKQGYAYDPKRDAAETTWIAQADDRDLPVLAICRGLQMLNVARGGDLHLDVRTIAERRNYPGAGIWPSLTFRKKATIEAGSTLRRIVNAGCLTINALHTQAANQIGKGLRVTARDGDSIVQGLEDPSRRFCLAVQFHPELLLYSAQHRALFSGLVRAAQNAPASTHSFS
jgi:putative glutamine amidotransferase